MRKKNIIYTLVVLALMLIVYKYRESQNGAPKRLIVLQGQTMGTTYQIKYIGSELLQREIDSVLIDFNQSLSTYIPNSEISIFNQQDSFVFQSPYFRQVLEGSKKISTLTEGAFDPTVMPLVRAWGFGPNKEILPELPQLDSLLQFVGMDKIEFDERIVRKKKTGMQLDFNAIAQGQASDVIGELLKKHQIDRFMVEIGGEVLCSGKNENNEFWKIGIENPQVNESGQDKVFAAVSLENAALVTSGNYRKFYIKDGKKIPHSINPKTGKPVEHSLLSATVVTQSCMDADALATAFMVMGVEKAMQFAAQHKDINIFLIYEENGKLTTYTSAGMLSLMKEAQ